MKGSLKLESTWEENWESLCLLIIVYFAFDDYKTYKYWKVKP